jgi:intracellular sulfur oxidation DsrE/DsrF family protein
MSCALRILFTAFTLVLAAAQIGCSANGHADAASDDGVLVHLRSDPGDAHSLLMGLQMATLMSETRPVLVYVDVHAIPLVLDDGPKMDMQPFGSADDMLGGLLERGVPIYACPGCLKAAGKSAADLRRGVQVAEKEAFFDFAAGRILVLDY